MRIRRYVLIGAVILAILVSVWSQYLTRLDDLVATARTSAVQINRYLDLSKAFIDLMMIHGSNTLVSGVTVNETLYDQLFYDTASDSFHLDAIAGSALQKITGNLTGIGPLPTDELGRAELNLALQYNQHFNSIAAKLPDITWLYYTSEQQFINLYPFVPSSEFSYRQMDTHEAYYTSAMPANNLLRQSVWTPVYLDQAGQGLMVTLSGPIYYHDTFMGVISLDLTNKRISEMVQSLFDVAIIGDDGAVIASSLDNNQTHAVLSVKELFRLTQADHAQVMNLENNRIRRIGTQYYYTVALTNAPWHLLVRASIAAVVGRAVVFALPVITICLLLLFMFIEVEKRKRTEIKLVTSINELSSYQKMLENAAKYDFLTATVNRRGLKDVIQSIKLGETGRRVCFIMGDIDHFKQFNDAHGHAAGDQVLREIAAIMQQNIGQEDVVCRWGGEEFVIMLLDKNGSEACQIAESIRAAIERCAIPWEHDTLLQATMTFGVAAFQNDSDYEKIIALADAALYAGKDQGRNRVVAADNCR